MRAVIQRIQRGCVTVDSDVVGKAKQGLLVFLGVGGEDTDADISYMVDKLIHLRLFEDENEKMNLSIQDVQGELLVVSQFTLYGDVRKGRRPSFDKAAPPAEANAMYEKFVAACREQGVPTETGVFQAHMMVELVNDGPVTILLDSKKLF